MNKENAFRLRLLILAGFMLGGFAILLSKLWYEQIHFGERYRQSISRQSVRRVRLPGLRGRIFTSDYLLLADNAPSYNLVFYLQEMRRNSRKRTIENIRKVAAELSGVLNRPDNLTEKDIRRHIITLPGVPLVIYENLDQIELASAFQMMQKIPGLGIEVEPVRHYPQRSLAAGTLGFARPVDPKSAPDRKNFFYYFSDFQGRSGVERAFDKTAGAPYIGGLQSTPGYELIQVDHLGYVSARQLEVQPAQNGNNITLTINSRAQILGESLMRGKRGAMVLLDADTGAVLALVSMPGFDLSRTTPVWPMDYYRELQSDPGRPMFARAIYGSYMPGSIIKPLVALAALKAGVEPEEKIECDGGSTIGQSRIACANRYGHGEMDMVTALERSCNDYFIEVGTKLGLERLQAMYKAAGVGEPTGLEIGGAQGLLPAREFKQKRYRKDWNTYDTALVSIGQGLMLISPLQAARFAAALANGGRLPKLHLLKEVTDDQGRLLYRTVPQLEKAWDLPSGALDTVKKGMFQVVNSPLGSGRGGRSSKLTIYGKTGTAEVDTRRGRINNTWFTAFAEHKNRRYALAVLVEEGRSGGHSCAPLARTFLERFLLEEQ